MHSSVPPTIGELAWRVARQCNAGNCVQIAPMGEMVVMGDSKNPDGPLLTYSRSEFRAFAEGIRQGEFDDLM